ncbi:hypothetical protein L1049_007131 [Liquidambar formosana]|uniref:Uncharacterized protein n=1 Tax=Liquidambar formosana TaxID=63359 RepID=A0AAP0WUL9_LIQFO
MGLGTGFIRSLHNQTLAVPLPLRRRFRPKQVKMVSGLINANPVVYEKKERRVRTMPCDVDEYAVEPIDNQEIFDILSD